ncbi:MAG: EAL domain-containing protein [Candidatus Eremiobacteraeota bacterium]|nr:EAL domain-containing protein [Candidatus Eremiobacteraeota bacterium]
MARVDLNGTILEVNEALRNRTGFALDDFRGRRVHDFFPPEEAATADAMLAAAARGDSATRDVRLRRLDGSYGERELVVVPIVSDGSVTGAFFCTEDISERVRAQRALVDSEQRFRSLFEHNPEGVVAVDRTGIVIDANDAGIRVAGRTREEMVGHDILALVDASQVALIRANFERVLEGQAVTYEYERDNERGYLCLECCGLPMFANGTVVGAYFLMQNATDRRIAEREAARQAARIRELCLVAARADGTDSQIALTLQAGCTLLGMDVGALVNAQTAVVEHRHDAVERSGNDSADLAAISNAILLAGGPLASSSAPGRSVYSAFLGVPMTVNQETYGTLCFAATHARPAITETDLDLVALMTSLLAGALERRDARAHLRRLAYSDALTGMPNRALLLERFRDALEAAQSRFTRVAILTFDLDRFKDVNETLGHALGDRLLQCAAERLAATLGNRGLVARTGGDEFVALLPNCESLEQIRGVADELLKAVDAPFDIDDYEQYITTSIGIAVYPDDGKDDQTLLKNADIAMYRAKDLGRNAYQFYSAAFEAPIHMRLSQEKLLRQALAQREFELAYQPIVELRSGRVVALEALLRWRHPKTGIIYPNQFIPSAEASGLIVPLGAWVLAEAARDLRRLQSHYPELRVAVNLSARQFHQPDLRETVLHALEDARVATSSLEVEITESIAMADAAHSEAIMRELVDSGIHLSLDDFGTGYSSLSYLRRFPVSLIKIDRTFVDGIGSQPDDETIVITVIAMAHNLGLHVVAEGVETSEQVDFLRAYGCDRLQGYYVAKAAPASRVEEFLPMWEAKGL